MNRRLFGALVGLILTVAPAAFAEGWIHTGDALRTKSVGPFNAKVYAISHDMKERPAAKTKQAMIDADVDKQFTWYMQRDVPVEKIKTALREAFAMNGYKDGTKIEQFVGAFTSGEVLEYDAKKSKEPSVVINYSAAAKAVTIKVAGHGSARVEGVDFMKGVWSIWFGRIDQPSMGDQLMARL